MTSTRTPTVAPKAMAGNPAVAKADRKNEYNADADRLLGTRAARQAQILKFKKEQGQHGLVSLDAAIEWLEECNRELLTERIGKIWKALSGDVSIFKIGGDLLPSATIVQEDSSPPVSEFNALDLAAARKTKMYDEPRALRTLIERLWVPRDVLLKLFQQKNWSLPPWIDPPPAKPAAKKRGRPRGTGKHLFVVEYFGKRFPESGIPRHTSRKTLTRELIDAVPALNSSLDPQTLKKAIEQHNEKVSQNQRD